jgi:hypothetical protein
MIFRLQLQRQVNQNNVIIRVFSLVFIEKFLEIFEFWTTIQVLIQLLEQNEHFLAREDAAIGLQSFHQFLETHAL